MEVQYTSNGSVVQSLTIMVNHLQLWTVTAGYYRLLLWAIMDSVCRLIMISSGRLLPDHPSIINIDAYLNHERSWTDK